MRGTSTEVLEESISHEAMGPGPTMPTPEIIMAIFRSIQTTVPQTKVVATTTFSKSTSNGCARKPLYKCTRNTTIEVDHPITRAPTPIKACTRQRTWVIHPQRVILEAMEPPAGREIASMRKRKSLMRTCRTHRMRISIQDRPGRLRGLIRGRQGIMKYLIWILIGLTLMGLQAHHSMSPQGVCFIIRGMNQ